MGSKNVTIMDIARKTGFSKSTVSRVLCNDAHVSEEAREKILSSAKELNFKPNYFAKALKTQRSNTIAYLVPNIEITVYPSIIQAVEEEALKRGYTILLCDIQEDKSLAKAFVENLKARPVDGFIFSTALAEDENEEIKEIIEAGIPCVNLLRDYECDFPSVVNNNALGSILAVDYLLSKGKKRIAYLQGQEYIKLYKERYCGYLEALEKNGLELDPSLVWQGYKGTEINAVEEVCSKLRQGVKFDALFCSSDHLAADAVYALHEEGKTIPEDISVMGYDNLPISKLLYPRLTTIGQPVKEMGRKAVNVLIDMIEDKSSISSRKYVFDPELIVRNSVL